MLVCCALNAHHCPLWWWEAELWHQCPRARGPSYSGIWTSCARSQVWPSEIAMMEGEGKGRKAKPVFASDLIKAGLERVWSQASRPYIFPAVLHALALGPWLLAVSTLTAPFHGIGLPPRCACQSWPEDTWGLCCRRRQSASCGVSLVSCWAYEFCAGCAMNPVPCGGCLCPRSRESAYLGREVTCGTLKSHSSSLG